MVPVFLLPESAIQEDGAGVGVAIEPSAGKSMMITLGITRVAECESLEVTVHGSADGNSWRHIASFPPKSYCGAYTVPVDMSGIHRDVCYLRAEWKMSRWEGRGPKPLFDFYILAEPLHIRVAGAA